MCGYRVELGTVELSCSSVGPWRGKERVSTQLDQRKSIQKINLSILGMKGGGCTASEAILGRTHLTLSNCLPEDWLMCNMNISHDHRACKKGTLSSYHGSHGGWGFGHKRAHLWHEPLPWRGLMWDLWGAGRRVAVWTMGFFLMGIWIWNNGM